MKNKILLIGLSLICLFHVSVFAVTETFWDTNWKAMRLFIDDNNKVTGEYIHDDGVITGTLQGKILQGWWREYNNAQECGPSNTWSGPLVFQFSDDGQSFTGSWASCSTAAEDLDPLGDGWTGTKRDSGYTESECTAAGRYWCNDDCQIQVCEAQITQTECEKAGKFWCDETCQYEQCSMNTDPEVILVTQGMDTWTYGNEPTTEHSTSEMTIAYAVSNCNPAMARGYIQFDLNNSPSDVEQVLIGVTHYPHTEYCYSNCEADFYFYPVLEPWQDDTLVYDNMPTEGPSEFGPLHIAFPNDFGKKEYDVTNLYRKWKSGEQANYGISIHSPTVGCNNAAAQFVVYSLDAEDPTVRPYLKVISSTKREAMDTWSHGNEPDADKSDDKALSGHPVSTCNPAMARAYLYFDISEYPDDVEEVVLGVTHFPHTEYCYSNCEADFYFYPVLEAWQDDTLNYNNMPKEDEAALGPIPISFPNNFGTKEYNITDLYRQWKSGTLENYGISIHSPTVGCNNAAASFLVHSLEAEDVAKRPYIRVKGKNKSHPAIYYLLFD